jgi:hypothetical protein
MDLFITLLVCVIAGAGAGVATGLAGLSAATIIAPMLSVFLGVDAYAAVGVALASDVLASGVASITYAKNKNIDVKNGLILLISVLIFTMVGSYVASLTNVKVMGTFSVFLTFLVGIKFIFRPVTTSPEKAKNKSKKRKIIESLICGIGIGFVCGYVGAGGGMMMLIVLTSILGYDLKTAVGTSVFVMTFTALLGAGSHIALGEIPNWTIYITCVISTLVFSQIAAIFANKVNPKILNRAVGVILTCLGIALIIIHFIKL